MNKPKAKLSLVTAVKVQEILGYEVETMRNLSNGEFKGYLTKVMNQWVWGYDLEGIKANISKSAQDQLECKIFEPKWPMIGLCQPIKVS